eukprot:scaffold489235_cov142-Attheya_sp.AAC.1
MQDIPPQQHQYMFNTTLEDCESLTTTQLSEWILKYKLVIKACLNTAQLQLKQNSSDIRKFYPSTATIPATKSKTTRRRTTVTRRKYKQVNLHNRNVSPSIITNTTCKKTKGKLTQAKAPVRNQNIKAFFTPLAATRENHRKLNTKEKSTKITQATSSRGESNRSQSRSGDK